VASVKLYDARPGDGHLRCHAPGVCCERDVVAVTGDDKGPLIVLGAALAFALYNVILKPLLGHHDLLALTAATSLVGTLGLLSFVRASTVDAVVDASAADASLVLYLGVLATFLGYIGWNVGLRGLGPTRAVAYTYAISPLAVLIGAVVLDEPVTLWLAVGAALVVGGIALTQRSPAGRRGAFREPEVQAP